MSFVTSIWFVPVALTFATWVAALFWRTQASGFRRHFEAALHGLVAIVVTGLVWHIFLFWLRGALP